LSDEIAEPPEPLGRADLVPLAALVVLVVALFVDVVARGQVFFERDVHLFWLGQIASIRRCLAEASWPLWDASFGFGQPLLANPSAQILYPATWIALFGDPGAAYTIYVVSHVLFSGCGLYLLARRLELSRGAALVSAALWTTSGPFLSLVSLWHHLAGAAWLPWVLVAADCALRSPRATTILLWGAAQGAQILTGSADLSAMTVGVTLAYGLGFAYAAPEARGANARRAAAALLAFVFALALSAGQWLPAADYARGSARFGLAEGIRTYWSLHPASLLQLVFPLLPQSLPLREDVRAALFESREPFLASPYLGIAALGLAALGLATSARLPRGLGVLAGLSIVVALGRYGLAYELLTTALPPLRILRYPSKALVLAAFATALLAGLGVEAWRKGAITSRRRLRFVVGCAAAGAGVALGLALLLRLRAGAVARFLLEPSAAAPDSLAPLAGASQRAALAAAALTILLLTSGPGRRAGRGAAAAGLLAVLDLFLAHRSLQPTMPAGLLAEPPKTLAAIDWRGPTRLYAFEYGPRLLGRTYRRPERKDALLAPLDARLPAPLAEALGLQAYLLSSVSRRWGLDGSYGGDVLGLYPRPLFNLNLVLRATEETDDFVRLLRIGGVRYVTALHDEGLESLRPVARFPGLVREPIRVFEVPDTLPRTYAVSGARILDGLKAYQTLVDPAFDARREVILPQGAPSSPAPGFQASARFLERRADRVRVEADLSANGYVVVLEGYERGWRAAVDGVPTPVLRANAVFRAVPVSAGRHDVLLLYRPAAATAGVMVSLGAALGGLGLAFLRRESGPPASSSPDGTR
jgi:hypothetical protein